jgi:hypothetical protein
MLNILFGFSNNDNEIQLLKTKLDEQNVLIYQQTKLIQEQNDLINVLQNENKKFKLSLDNYKSHKNNYTNILNYLNKNCNDANILESIIDYSLINYKSIDVKFHIYIGDFIIKYYKKSKHSEQSIWSYSTYYLIRELDINNKLIWNIDKKGIKMSDIIINPIVNHMKNIIAKYISRLFTEESNNTDESQNDRNLCKISKALNVMKNIDDKILHKKIFRYITPHFLFNNNQ